MTFGEKLQELRNQAGLSQAQLAGASSVPVGTIRDYEQAKRTPLLGTAVKLARAVGVSVEVFADCNFEERKSKPAARGRLKGK